MPEVKKYQLINAEGKRKWVDSNDFDSNLGQYISDNPGVKIRMTDKDGGEYHVDLKNYSKAKSQGARGFTFSQTTVEKPKDSPKVEGTGTTAQQAVKLGNLRFGNAMDISGAKASTIATEQQVKQESNEKFTPKVESVEETLSRANQQVKDAGSGIRNIESLRKDITKRPTNTYGGESGVTLDNEGKLTTKSNAEKQRLFNDTYDKARVESRMNKDINPIVQQIQQNLEGQSQSYAMDVAKYGGMENIGNLKTINEIASPEALSREINKIDWDSYINQVTGRDANGNYNFEITEGAKRNGMTPDEYVQNVYIPQMSKSIDSQMQAVLGERYKVKNGAEYIARELANGWVGQLTSLATTTKGMRQQNAQALQDYQDSFKRRDEEGNLHTTWSSFGVGAAGLAAETIGDLPLFVLGGNVGNLALKGTANVIKTVSPRASRWLLPNVAKYSGAVAQRYENYLMANMGKAQWYGRQLLRGSIAGSANMGTFMGIKGVTSTLTMGDDTSGMALLKSAWDGIKEGALMGTALGATGMFTSRLGAHAGSAASRMGVGLGGKIAEVGTFTGVDYLKNLNNPDWNWTDNIAQNAQMIVGMGIGMKVSKPHALVGAMSRVHSTFYKPTGKTKVVAGVRTPIFERRPMSEVWHNFTHGKSVMEQFKLTDDDRDMIRRAYPNSWLTDVMDMERLTPEEKKAFDEAIAFDAEYGTNTAGYVGRDFVDLLQNTDNVSWELRNKISIGLFGVGEGSRPLTNSFAIQGKGRVQFIAKDGSLIAERKYKNAEELADLETRERMNTEHQRTVNSLSHFTLCDYIGEDVKDQASDALEAVANEYGMTPDEVFNLSFKDPMKMNVDERSAFKQLGKYLDGITKEYNNGKMAPESSAEQGNKDATDAVNIETGNVDADLIAQADENNSKAQQELQIAKQKLDGYILSTGNNIDMDNIDYPEVIEMVNQGATETDVRPIVDYIKARNNAINAQAYRDAFVQTIGQEINHAIEKRHDSVAFSPLKGENADGRVITVTDEKGNSWYLKSGPFDLEKGEFDRSGDATDMCIVVDEEGNVEFKSADALTINGMQLRDEWMNPRITQLQEEISQYFGVENPSANTQGTIETGEVEGQSQQGEPQQTAPSIPVDEKGNKDYSGVDANIALDDIINDLGGDINLTREAVEGELDTATKAHKKAVEKKTTGILDAKKKAVEVADAKKKMDMWQSIKDALDERTAKKNIFGEKVGEGHEEIDKAIGEIARVLGTDDNGMPKSDISSLNDNNVIELLNKITELGSLSLTEREKAYLDDIVANASERGFSIRTFEGKDFENRLGINAKVKINDTLAPGTSVVTKDNKPMILKEGRLVQAADVDVESSRFDKEGLITKEDIDNLRGNGVDKNILKKAEKYLDGEYNEENADAMDEAISAYHKDKNRQFIDHLKSLLEKTDEENVIKDALEDEINKLVTNEEVKNFEPETIEERVIFGLTNLRITPESFNKETGGKFAERKRLVGFIAGKAKGGVSVERASEIIWGDLNDSLKEQYSQPDIRNMVIDALKTGVRPDSLIKDIISERTGRFVSEARQDLLNQLDNYYREEYGMSFEEWSKEEKEIVRGLIDKYEDVNLDMLEDFINEERAKAEENEKQAEDAGTERGTSVLHPEESGNERGVGEGDKSAEGAGVKPQGEGEERPLGGETPKGEHPVEEPNETDTVAPSGGAKTSGTEIAGGNNGTPARNSKEEADEIMSKNPLTKDEIDKYAVDVDEADDAKAYIDGDYNDFTKKAYLDIYERKAKDAEQGKNKYNLNTDELSPKDIREYENLAEGLEGAETMKGVEKGIFKCNDIIEKEGPNSSKGMDALEKLEKYKKMLEIRKKMGEQRTKVEDLDDDMILPLYKELLAITRNYRKSAEERREADDKLNKLVDERQRRLEAKGELFHPVQDAVDLLPEEEARKLNGYFHNDVINIIVNDYAEFVGNDPTDSEIKAAINGIRKDIRNYERGTEEYKTLDDRKSMLIDMLNLREKARELLAEKKAEEAKSKSPESPSDGKSLTGNDGIEDAMKGFEDALDGLLDNRRLSSFSGRLGDIREELNSPEARAKFDKVTKAATNAAYQLVKNGLFDKDACFDYLNEHIGEKAKRIMEMNDAQWKDFLNDIWTKNKHRDGENRMTLEDWAKHYKELSNETDREKVPTGESGNGHDGSDIKEPEDDGGKPSSGNEGHNQPMPSGKPSVGNGGKGGSGVGQSPKHGPNVPTGTPDAGGTKAGGGKRGPVGGNGGKSPNNENPSGGARPTNGGNSGTSNGGEQESGSTGSNTGKTSPTARVDEGELRKDGKVLYKSRSKGNPMKNPTVAPKEIAEAMGAVLDRLGDVDEYVREALGYDTVEKMQEGLSSEQIDGVAMGIYNMRNGHALINSDQTGLGKGRQVAALLKYGINNGLKPLLITESDKLFKDNYRDMVNIGLEDLTPFIIASNKQTAEFFYENKKNPEKSRMFTLPSKEEMDSFLATGKIPDGYDYAVTTYNQIAPMEGTPDKDRTGESSKDVREGKDLNLEGRRKAVAQLGKNNVVIFDESHKAAGDGGTGRYCKQIVRDARGVAFFSATYAKRPDNMPLYALRSVLQDAHVSEDDIIEAIKNGGPVFQEILAKALADSGGLIRRERDMTGVVVDWEKTNLGVEEQRGKYDSFINEFRNITAWQNKISKKVKEHFVKMYPGKNVYVKYRSNDASLFNIANQLYTSLKVEDTIRRAIEIHNEKVEVEVDGKKEMRNQKVFIPLHDVCDALITESFVKGETMRKNDLSVALERNLKKAAIFTVNIEVGKGIRVTEEADASQLFPAEFRNEMTRLESFESGLSVSPVDALKEGLRDAGLKVEEITGRKNAVERQPDGTYKLNARKRPKANDVIDDYNNGKLDVVILNESGSTGSSLQASEEFADQRVRHSFTLQAMLDVAQEMQVRGRVDRSGQLYHAIYSYLVSSIPAENRLMMMLKAKLKSLDAQTTASQKSSYSAVDVADITNKYGSQVIVDLMKDEDKWISLLGDPFGWLTRPDGGSKYTASEDDFNKVLKRLPLLLCEEQEEFLEKVSKRYNDKIEELNAAGMNDLELADLPLEAETKNIGWVIEGEVPGGNNVFADSTYIEEVEVNNLDRPYNKQELEKTILNTLKGKSDEDYRKDIMSDIDSYFEDKKEKFEKQAKNKFDRSVEFEKKIINKEFEDSKNTDTPMTEEERDRKIAIQTTVLKDKMDEEIRMFELKSGITTGTYRAVINKLKIGSYIVGLRNVNGVQTRFDGVVTGFDISKSKKANSSYVIVASAKGTKVIKVPFDDSSAFNSMLNDALINAEDKYKEPVKNWDSIATMGDERETRYIYTGNLLMALAQDRRGQLAKYTAKDGTTKQGIILPKKTKLTDIGRRLPFSKAIDRILKLDRNAELQTSDKRFTVINKAEGRSYSCTYQLKFRENKENLETVCKDKRLAELCYMMPVKDSDTGYFGTSKGKVFTVDLPRRKEYLQPILDHLTDVYGAEFDDAVDFTRQNAENNLPGITRNNAYNALTARDCFEKLASPQNGEKMDDDILDLAEKVFDIAEALGTKFSFGTTTRETTMFGTTTELGFYNPAKNELRLRWNHIMYNKNRHDAAQTMLHETIHVVTSYAFDARKAGKPMSKELAEAVDEIIEIQNLINADPEYSAQIKQNKFSKEWYGAYNYDGRNPGHEAVAEMANPKWRARLKQMNLWQRWKNAVSGVIKALWNQLGLPTNDKTAFERMDAALNKILDNFDTNLFREMNGKDSNWDGEEGTLKRFEQEDVLYRKGEKVEQSPERTAEMAKVAQKHIDALGGKGKVHTSLDSITDAQVREECKNGAKGWYDTKTGEVHIFAPNCKSNYDAQKTIFHEKVGHEGLRNLMGEKQFNKFLHQVFGGMEGDVRKEVIADAAKRGWDFNTAIDEYLAKKAEDFKDDSPSVKRFFKSVVTAINNWLQSKGWKNFSMTENDVREALWLSKNALENKKGSLEYRIRKAAFEAKLKRNVPKEQMDANKSKFTDAESGTVRYKSEGKRDKSVPTPKGESDRSLYDRIEKSVRYLWTEAHQNALRSIQLAQLAVVGKNGVVKDSENVFMALNRLGSTDQTEMENFTRTHAEPFTELVSGVLPKFDGKNVNERYKNFEKYLIAKHGLERNRTFYVRDEVKKLLASDDPTDKALGKQIQIDYDTLRKAAKRNLDNGSITLADYFDSLDNFIRTELNDEYDASKMDKSGLSDSDGFPDWAKPEDGHYDEKAVLDYIADCESKMTKPVVDDIYNKVKAMTDFTLNKQYESGMVSKGQYERAKEMFDWYVPLRGFDADTAEDLWNYIGHNGKPSVIGMMHANMRNSMARNPIATMMVMANGAIMQGNRNVAKQHLFRLVHNNANDLFTEMNLWYEKKNDATTGEDYLEPIYPDINFQNGKEKLTAAEMKRAMDNYDAKIEALKADPDRVIVFDRGRHGDLEIKFERDSDAEQHMVHTMIGGKRRTIFVNGNPRVAQAVNGMVRDKNMPVVKSFNNWMSQMATSKSATFIMRNGARDFQYANATIEAVEGHNYLVRFDKNYLRLGMTAMNNHSMHSLMDRYQKGTLNDTDEIDRYFKEFMDNGGRTGFVQMTTVDSQQKAIERIMKNGEIELAKSGHTMYKVNKGVSKALGVWFDTVQSLNEAVENQTRFATYMTSRQYAKRTIARSIYDAKNASVNFNITGAGWGTFGMKTKDESTWHMANRIMAATSATFLRNAVIFYNAGVQGMSRTAQVTFGGDKKQMMKSIALIGAMPFAAGALMPLINQIFTSRDTDDEKKRFGDNPYAQLPEYERRQNLCLYIGHGRFLKLPIPIELRAFYGIGDMVAGGFGRAGMYDKAEGLDAIGITDPENKSSVAEHYIMGVMKEVAQITPVDIFGGSKAVSNSAAGGVAGLVIPSFFAPVVAAGFAGLFGVNGTNIQWTGSPISRRNDFSSTDPEWQKASAKTNETLKDITKWLSDHTGGDNREGGFINLNPSSLQYLAESYGSGAAKDIIGFASVLSKVGKSIVGKDTDFVVDEAPGVKAFFRSRTVSNELSVARTRYYNYKTEASSTEKRLAKYKSDAKLSVEYAANYYDYTKNPAVGRAMIINKFDTYIKKLQHAKNDMKSIADKNAIQDQINVIMCQAVDMIDRYDKMVKERSKENK